MIVYTDRPYFITLNKAVFADGYNVYREATKEEIESGEVKEGFAKKINPRMGWFNTLEEAINFVKEERNK
jgi:hypothetical protein